MYYHIEKTRDELGKYLHSSFREKTSCKRRFDGLGKHDGWVHILSVSGKGSITDVGRRDDILLSNPMFSFLEMQLALISL